MNENQCNGWTNYPTWIINLWSENDAGSYEMWRETTRAALRTSSPVDTLAEEMKNVHETAAEEQASGELLELLQWALEYVNWEEIAESWIANLKDDAE